VVKFLGGIISATGAGKYFGLYRPDIFSYFQLRSSVAGSGKSPLHSTDIFSCMKRRNSAAKTKWIQAAKSLKRWKSLGLPRRSLTDLYTFSRISEGFK
jgi:hypothetical protein